MTCYFEGASCRRLLFFTSITLATTTLEPHLRKQQSGSTIA